MLRRKLPEEIFDGSRTLPTSLFRRDDVTSYLANLVWALELTVAELGADGAVDVFDLTRRLGSPDGPGLLGGARLGAGRRVRAAGAGVRHPGRLGCLRAPRRDGRGRRRGQGRRARRPRRHRRASSNPPSQKRFRGRQPTKACSRRIVDAWSGEPSQTRIRGVAMDVALIHIASMSNLMAALGWALVDVIDRPAERDACRRGRRGVGAAVRAGEHPDGAALHHGAGGPGASGPGHRRGDLPGAGGLDDRDAAAVTEHVGRSRVGPVAIRDGGAVTACEAQPRSPRQPWSPRSGTASTPARHNRSRWRR